jgi:polysaccharide biosynthesis/export protein
MRMAIWSAMLAALPVLCAGMSSPQPADPASADQQQALPAPAAGLNPATDPTKVAGPATLPGQAPAGVAVDASSFILGPDDQIMIRVWGDERLSGGVLVRPDGRISINLIGEVVAAGRTPEQLGKDIEDILKKKEILMRPSVTVTVTSVQSKKYSINGEVNKTGSFPLTTPTKVMEALVNAGGFKDFANKSKIQVMRGDKIFRFNWNDYLKGKHREQNILLEPGDIIIVK